MKHSPYLRIVIWGDSIAWGADDFANGGWAGLLRRDYGKAKRGRVYNRGIGGLRTDQLLKTLASEAEIIKPDAVIFAIGVNDSKHSEKIPARVYRENLVKLVKIVGRYTRRVAFAGLTRINEAALSPLPAGEKLHSNKAIEAYDQVLRSFCKSKKILYLELSSILKPQDLSDGLHPNTTGHRKIYRLIKPFADRLLDR